jgi:putative transmembrane protein PGPGW
MAMRARGKTKQFFINGLTQLANGLFNNPFGRSARKLLITLVGSLVTLIGIVLIVLPGPASLLIPIGLTILALEYPLAKSWLRKFQRLLRSSAVKADALLDRIKARFKK